MKKRLFKILKLFIIFLYIFISGFFGLSLLFSDYGPGETHSGRMMTIFLFYLITGTVFGFLFPKNYKKALFIAWPVFLMLPFVLLETLQQNLFFTAEILFVVLPLVGLIFGSYAGYRMKKASRKKPNKTTI